MVRFFLSQLERKLPQGCQKQVGGRVVKATFGKCPKVSVFLDVFPWQGMYRHKQSQTNLLSSTAELDGRDELGEEVAGELPEVLGDWGEAGPQQAVVCTPGVRAGSGSG